MRPYYSFLSAVATVVLSVIMCPVGSLGGTPAKRISLDDVVRLGTFTPRSVDGLLSMQGGGNYTALLQGTKIAQYSYATGEQEVILFSLDDTPIDGVEVISGYQFCPNEEFLLLETNKIPIYRYSYRASYYIFRLTTGEIFPLSGNGAQRQAAFSPDGSRVAFVRSNNIYLKVIATGQEIRITHDGEQNSIINGAADWVYEEEFMLKTAFKWSPDGKRLAFFRFDESNVKQYHLPFYYGQLYPYIYTFKYPKAGEDNALVSIHVYDIGSQTSLQVDIGEETNQYIPRIKWTANPNKLAVVRMNRLQNHLDILIADATSGESQVLYTETNKYFVQPPNDMYPTFTPDGEHFIIQSEQDGWNHLYLYGMDGSLVRQLTDGSNEVTEFYGADMDSERLYYQAVDENPTRRAVFSVGFNGQVRKLSALTGTNSASFSSTWDYYIHFYSSSTMPTVVTLHNAKGEEIRVLEDNSDLNGRVQLYQIPEREFFSFSTSEDVQLNGYIIKPLGFDSLAEYPVMMYQYSGPGSQRVTDRWKVGWEEYLASEGFIVVCVDGRGTGGRGEEFRKMTYGQLGYYETIDQIEAARYLQSLPYVDLDRMGIWGWSYGGYISALALFKGSDVFRLGISVAPVTNWRFYDTIYTERYMGLPDDNPSGYDDNSPVNHAHKLEGQFMLVHGSADDNVHLQNTLELSEALVQANKPFTQMIYLDKNHGIFGGNTRIHLYSMLTEFVKENL